MKINKTIVVLLLFISFSYISCDDYLNEVPDDRQEIKTLENLSELLVSGYSEASYNFIEWKTDNAVAIIGNTQYNELTENFQFVPVVSSEEQDTPGYFWANTYNAIAHANQVLAEIDNVENTNNALKMAIKGEALLIRAYNHFMLANIFCQHYSATNASGLGIPYILAPETALQVNYERGTLQETYDLIEADLIAGLPLVSNDYYTGSGKYHFNKNAANAFASRFYLYIGEYQKSIDYADKIFGTGTISSNFIKNMTAVYTGTSTDEIAANFYDVYDASNFLVVRKESVFVTRYNRGYSLNRAVVNEILNTTLQGGGEDTRNLMYGYLSGALAPPKYAELFRYTTSTTGYPYYIQPELRSEEVIFNRMESNVRLNKLNEALIDYNALAPSRYSTGGQLTIAEINTYYGGTEQEAMLEFVYSERRKEFIREGLRWFDIKRFEKPIVHIDVKGDKFTLSENDLKKAIQIPEGAIIQGIEANPR